jgi:ADP-ribose pyrophosphatase YjhB (NUDIX family)
MPSSDPGFRFCPVCGAHLEARLLKAGDPERLVCPSCRFVLYLDPKVAVGTIVGGAGDRVLLLRRAIEPGYGKWVFPGGYVDRGEIVEQAALREAREECGLEVRLTGLIGMYSYQGRTPIVIVYSAVPTRDGGDGVCMDEESLEARWFAPAEIPWADLAFSSTGDALRDYLEGRVYRRLGPQRG